MKCLEFQQQISDFLDNRLTVDEVRLFVEHADSCPECMEELELRYMIQVGILEQNRDESGYGYDFSIQLNDLLDRTKRSLRYRHNRQVIKYSVSTAVFWAVCTLLLIQLRVWLIG
ncbi:MAG: zf-HC2 domain-containing protein [Lachnospiraceae bacterium]|nr:zf-HC2 domain-containing protein [Lachnospiraceae bacterium]